MELLPAKSRARALPPPCIFVCSALTSLLPKDQPTSISSYTQNSRLVPLHKQKCPAPKGERGTTYLICGGEGIASASARRSQNGGLDEFVPTALARHCIFVCSALTSCSRNLWLTSTPSYSPIFRSSRCTNKNAPLTKGERGTNSSVEVRGFEPLSKHNRQKLSTCLFRH